MDESKLPHSHTGGVRPMSIEGRFADERTRLSAEFTDADRAWRKKWLEDQHLSPNEPRHVPELERALKNPFRRFYRFPMDYIFGRLEPFLGPHGDPRTALVRPQGAVHIRGRPGSDVQLQVQSAQLEASQRACVPLFTARLAARRPRLAQACRQDEAVGLCRLRL
ncbi:hypothetical protein HPB48_021540 [Haemaphysalis longicornis]|uniref:Complex I-B17 n=1 Tax=Haemaphysalis longicornis TaxID=44386 RepID=A0A9J6GNX1_HAELO|nr:hypothetical protein HPB48_021540 [Haemaphysalis longicornis]